MSWMENLLWAAQCDVNEILSTYRPNPAEFPELPSASKSYWIRNYAIPEEQQWADQSIPTAADVVIIGSGITGAAAAYRFSQSRPDLRIALVEARGVCLGATGRNGGHLVRAEVFDVRELAKIFGAEDALRIRKIMLRNRDMVLEAIADLDAASEVDLRLDGSLNVFGSTEERDGFVEDVAFAREHGHASEGFVMEADQIVDSFGNFALVLAVASPIGGFLIISSYQIVYGGHWGLFWGWLIPAIIFTPQVLACAELCSSMPVNGANYWWTAALAPPKMSRMLSFVSGWTMVLQSVTSLASFPYAMGTSLSTLISILHPNWIPSNAQIIATYNEPLSSEVVLSTPNVTLSLEEYLKLANQILALRQKYLEKYCDTAKFTSTGRPVDVLILPSGGHVSPPHGKMGYLLYEAISNLLDWTCGTIPVGFVSQALDKKIPDHKFVPRSEEDRQNWEMYSPEIFKDVPVCLQVLGQRHDEEKVLGCMRAIDRALGRSLNYQA